MTNRIYIDANRVTMSKPGYSAESPPAIDYKYLALDSRLNTGRPLEIGQFGAASTNQVVNFSTTYAGIPAVDIVFWTNGAFYITYSSSVVIRDTNGTTAYNRTPYYLGIFNNRFQIVSDAVNVNSYLLNGSYQGFYIAWQNW